MSAGLVLLAAHLVGDFVLQTDRQAANKFDSAAVRAEHAAVVSVPVAVAAAVLPSVGWAFVALNGAAHFVIDTRRWAEPVPGFEARPIAVDQSLHVAAMAALVVVL